MSLSLFRPRAFTDKRWRAWVPRRPLTRRTLTVPVAAASFFLAMVQFLHLLAALGRDAAGRMHFGQALQGGAHEVDRVARTGGLGQHVLHAHRLEHGAHGARSEEHTSELQSRENLVCRLLL